MRSGAHISILLIGQRCSGSLLELGLVLLHERSIDLNLGRGKSGRGDKLEVGVADELAREPEEGLLEVVLYRRARA